MTPDAGDPHTLLGAYVLGGLSDDDHRTFSEHLRGCERCQAELGQVSGLPRLLDLAGPDGGPHLRVTDAGVPPATLPLSREGAVEDGRVADLLAEAARRRRRRRVWQSLTAAAAAVLLFAGGVWLGPRLSGTATPELPTTHLVAAAAPGSSLRVDIALVTRGWGTQLDLDCEDMPTDGQLALWVIDRSGRATSAASWRATPAGYSRLTGATALRPGEIEALEVRTSTGRVLATART